ncbi:hypothetical protein DICPUDRAFT_78552 [Dictyostelium purpureum]|uniref:RNA helicase n=1 Tax=Dictyostelium purpureum TaxID=5786 RepID=F0ZJW4_DICPU|nr:uncharacterized protein DICPUDRAFT_78552 [Dictyostelium purpureum]EGC35752.1 hypothetical protein DICPUDRAFT_78552 [Dictyostelium purpureum]|eukprot:XP_003287704.1 hypothetical protein DICPUDRAFT_78552 [Dictyostelium purpureum]
MLTFNRVYKTLQKNNNRLSNYIINNRSIQLNNNNNVFNKNFYKSFTTETTATTTEPEIKPKIKTATNITSPYLKDNNDDSNNNNNNNTQFKFFHPDIQNVLKEMKIDKPTIIQKKTIPALQSGVDAYIVDETGTGKSFGVMLEIMNRYYKDILENKTTNHSNKNNEIIKPKYIIISPTRELAWQFGYWIRNLLNRLLPENKEQLSKVQLAVNGIASEEILRKQLLLSNPDILIGTSNMLYPLVVNGFLSIDNLNMLYIDEADQIFQTLGKDAIEKQKKIRRDHPLPSSLLFNEIKRKVRENNHFYTETFEDQVKKLLKKNQHTSKPLLDETENQKPKYIKTDRPFQTIFSSATIGNTTKKEIKDRDWINVKSQFITALDENKVKSKDIRVNKNGEYFHGDLELAPFREQLSIINRLNHYFITVDSENQLINGVVDVWRNLKPTIAIGILSNDANISKICETIRKRNINCFTLSHAMNFQSFNVTHLPDSPEKEQILKDSELESKYKEINIKREIKYREKERKNKLKQERKLQQQHQKNEKLDEEDENVLEILKEYEKEWKLDQLDNKSVLYLAKEDAIRGIDIEDVSHVFILNIAVKPSSYLHMIGRTARMGKFGNVVCIYNASLSPKYLNTMNQLNIPFKEEDIY